VTDTIHITGKILGITGRFDEGDGVTGVNIGVYREVHTGRDYPTLEQVDELGVFVHPDGSAYDRDLGYIGAITPGDIDAVIRLEGLSL